MAGIFVCVQSNTYSASIYNAALPKLGLGKPDTEPTRCKHQMDPRREQQVTIGHWWYDWSWPL